MNSETALKGMISRASIILLEAEYLKEKEAWNMVVRRSQEAVELALKCALLWAGIEVPRIHDVGPILKRYSSVILSPLRAKSPISSPSLAC
jgi:HEPN domain-containing protein